MGSPGVRAAIVILAAAFCLSAAPSAAVAVPVSDFTISIVPSSGSTDPGHLISATVSSTTQGPAQPVNLTATGLPAGAEAHFYPSSLTSGESSTMQISTNTAVVPGEYPIVVTGAGTDATRTATYILTVNGPAGCLRTNDADLAIPDNSAVDSTLLISHCAGDASATSTVAVTIAHPAIGDLIISLVAPDGSAYLLHDRTGGDTDNVDQTYTVDLSSEPSDGTWKLRVQDVALAETGYLDTWTVNLRTGGGGSCTGTNSTDVAIPDAGRWVDSSITISGCPGAGSATSTVEVHIAHPRIGDLTVCLVAPNGIVHPLHERTGGSGDDIHWTYTVDLSGHLRDGTWDLAVSDGQTSQTGHLDSWTLTL